MGNFKITVFERVQRGELMGGGCVGNLKGLQKGGPQERFRGVDSSGCSEKGRQNQWRVDRRDG